MGLPDEIKEVLRPPHDECERCGGTLEFMGDPCTCIEDTEDSSSKETSLSDLFDIHQSEYYKFERIPENQRLHPNRKLCGLLKLVSLFKDPNRFEMEGQHDIIYLAHEDDVRPLTTDDVIYLSRCGIHRDSEGDCLAMF